MSLSRSRRHSHPNPRVEINIVPLVDVALVLLVIFMLTATFYKSAGFQVRLPSSPQPRAPRDANQDLVIGITAGGGFLWQGAPVTDTQLAQALNAYAAENGAEGRVTILGDERASHGRVVKAMSLADQANFSRLWISTTVETPTWKPRRK